LQAQTTSTNAYAWPRHIFPYRRSRPASTPANSTSLHAPPFQVTPRIAHLLRLSLVNDNDNAFASPLRLRSACEQFPVPFIISSVPTPQVAPRFAHLLHLSLVNDDAAAFACAASHIQKFGLKPSTFRGVLEGRAPPNPVRPEAASSSSSPDEAPFTFTDGVSAAHAHRAPPQLPPHLAEMFEEEAQAIAVVLQNGNITSLTGAALLDRCVDRGLNPPLFPPLTWRRCSRGRRRPSRSACKTVCAASTAYPHFKPRPPHSENAPLPISLPSLGGDVRGGGAGERGCAPERRAQLLCTKHSTSPTLSPALATLDTRTPPRPSLHLAEMFEGEAQAIAVVLQNGTFTRIAFTSSLRPLRSPPSPAHDASRRSKVFYRTASAAPLHQALPSPALSPALPTLNAPHTPHLTSPHLTWRNYSRGGRRPSRWSYRTASAASF
jgi:hypothetical protein